MPSTSRSEAARINLRTSPEAKALIERAAAIMGSTVSGFMLQNAYEAARRVVADDDTLVLSQKAFDTFVATCRKRNSTHAGSTCVAQHAAPLGPSPSQPADLARSARASRSTQTAAIQAASTRMPVCSQRDWGLMAVK